MADCEHNCMRHFRSLATMTGSHPYSSSSKKTCHTCAVCPPPCSVTAPSTPPPNTCQDNPCYFRSLPFACSAQQCQEFVNSTNGIGKAIIIDLPDELCITTCQMQSYTNYGFVIHRFGACTRYEDLTAVVAQGTSATPQPVINSLIRCGSDISFGAFIDQILYSRISMGSLHYYEDTVLQCTLELHNNQLNNELLATADFKMIIKYVPEDQCGKVSRW
ncbi:uncharacterized protein LOC129589876 isoform X2 [Paramacrobiotus metropolitanus]|uniref:uncharacterized protein LOC129589876 isoform X2 n=1 Tax=Paramacrobiotus metropolitanus TaxID=2943436 RepID=UPI002445B452|nr:uncharacterized protein LOC129589876 isoform X2 [Paramacrobiotus metropolitanus]